MHFLQKNTCVVFFKVQMMNYFIPPWANAHGVSFFMKEGVPEMSIANVGGGSCEEFWATGVFIVTNQPFC